MKGTREYIRAGKFYSYASPGEFRASMFGRPMRSDYSGTETQTRSTRDARKTRIMCAVSSISRTATSLDPQKLPYSLHTGQVCKVSR